MKMVRQRRPNSKYALQFDRLIIDNEVYMFNDLTGRIEQVNQNQVTKLDLALFALWNNTSQFQQDEYKHNMGTFNVIGLDEQSSCLIEGMSQACDRARCYKV